MGGMKIELIPTENENDFIFDVEIAGSYRGRITLNMKLNQEDRRNDLVSQIAQQLQSQMRAKVMIEFSRLMEAHQ